MRRRDLWRWRWRWWTRVMPQRALWWTLGRPAPFPVNRVVRSLQHEGWARWNDHEHYRLSASRECALAALDAFGIWARTQPAATRIRFLGSPYAASCSQNPFLPAPWPVPTIARYFFRCEPRCLYADAWYHRGVAPETPREGSQLWHRDPEDAPVLKIFLYGTDVTQASGAMELCPSTRRSTPSDDRSHCPDAPAPVVHLEGHRGDIVCADTTAWHRGGDGIEPRLMATWAFMSPATLARTRADR